MFLRLFRTRFTSRPQVKARTPVQTFRPQLETLEGRLAPSGFDLDIGSVSRASHVAVAENYAIAIDAHGNTFNQTAVAVQGVSLDIGGSHHH